MTVEQYDKIYTNLINLIKKEQLERIVKILEKNGVNPLVINEVKKSGE